MKNLLSLKKWLTLQEAARHLSILMGEDVRVADVLRLALDGHLKLSFNFFNHVRARKGKVIPIEEASYFEFDKVSAINLPKNLSNRLEPILVMKGLNLDDRRVLELEDQIVTLDGVFDRLHAV